MADPRAELRAAQEPPYPPVEQLCEIAHDAYELAAVDAGWETQASSRVSWGDVPTANKATMRAAMTAVWEHVCQEHFAPHRAELVGLRAELEAAREEATAWREAHALANARAEHDGIQLAEARRKLDELIELCDAADEADASPDHAPIKVRWTVAVRAIIAASRPSSPVTENSSGLSERYFEQLLAMASHPQERARIKAQRDQYRHAFASGNSSEGADRG